MCGIAGFVDFRKKSSKDDLLKMQSTLNHRGPDDSGSDFYELNKYVVGLAHTRLSILDLSEFGHQPMSYEGLSIILNGEIYNFQEIKHDLIALGHTFKSNSDTEVVLHAFREWRTDCVHKFVGMFAFLVYDSIEQKIFLCRDRVGVKPLYYYINSEIFLFASELKAFHKHKDFKKIVDKDSLALYLQFGYVPGPATIFENTFKLEPGSWLFLDLNSNTFTQEVYWKIDKFFVMPQLQLSYEEAKTELESLLKTSCKYRMVSDVPVGIFLSGGFDSTLVTALLQKDSSQKLKTFTIGFPDGINEAPHAEKIASHLKTDHKTYNCTEKDAKEIIPQLAYYYDEPFADISAIPSILVSRLARENVTVAISADGGDELFAGYSGFRNFEHQLKSLRNIPYPRAVSNVLTGFSSILPDANITMKRKMHGASRVLKQVGQDQVKALVEEAYDIPSQYIQGFLSRPSTAKHPVYNEKWQLFSDERNGFLFNSFQGPLRDFLLVKMDRATMSASLEGREPLLDHRLIEFAARLPYEFKHDGKTLKKILKDITYDYVPRDLMDRPKIGFDLPIFKWLQNELAFLVDELLDDSAFFEESQLNYSQVKTAITNFRENKLLYPDIVWRFVMLRLWHKQWMK